MQLPLRVPKTILSANLYFSRECIFILGSVKTYFASVLSHIFEQQHYNRQNNLTSLKQQHQRPPFYKRESQVWLGLGRESSRRSSYPGTHRAAEAEIRANSPSCSDCSRIKLPQFLTQCLRNMSKTVRIGVDSRWVGGSFERALRGQLSFYPGEAVSGCTSGGDDW